MTTIDWTIDILRSAGEKNFTGNLQINFFQGKVSNVNVLESIKPPKEEEVKQKIQIFRVQVPS